MPLIDRFALVLVLGAAACGARSPETPSPVAADDALTPTDARDRFIRSGLAPLGRTRAEIVEALGEPDSTDVWTLPNRHVPARTDSIFRLHYEALTAVVHVAGGRDFLVSVTVMSNRWLRDPIVRIGARWPDVRRRLGEPHEAVRNGFAYLCPTCGEVEEPVIVVVRGGVVEAVEFTYYLD